ncbi:DC1 [Dillenia turbinata]|uniref:DC1 n=1 Tax=Dillenia turbinata TaxID=194707 RepID=A0AAN8UY48_9MAGN
MGKVEFDLHKTHFSHPHLLELSYYDSHQPQPQNQCSGCKLLLSSGWVYTCKPCNFTLHTSCTQIPQLITHPCHSLHPLSLLPKPAYSAGFFSCDACGHRGDAFCYHCRDCDFDIHVTCAEKPLTVNHPSHAHQLSLFFYPPYDAKGGFSCDLCGRLGTNHWLYRCGGCEFDAHLDCATSLAPGVQVQSQQPQPLRHYHTFPGPNQVMTQPSGPQTGPGRPNHYYMHSASMGAVTNYQPAAQSATNYQRAVMNYPQYTATNYQQPVNNSTGGGLMDAAVQGMVDGAAQQAGQNFVQSFTGRGGNGGDSNNNDGNSSSSSILDVEASLVSGLFGNSSN